MAQSLRLLIPVLFGSVVAACADSDSMNAGGQDMSAALAQASSENQRHAEACDGVSSLPDMTSELTEHEHIMAGLMKRMDSARERMRSSSMMGRQCSGSSFDHMSDSLTGAHAEMAGHSERMRAADTLHAAQAECTTHTVAMNERMRGMMQDLGAMPCMGN